MRSRPRGSSRSPVRYQAQVQSQPQRSSSITGAISSADAGPTARSLLDRTSSFGHRCSIDRGCSIDPRSLFNHWCTFECRCSVDYRCRFDNTSRFDHRGRIERRCGLGHGDLLDHRCGIERRCRVNHSGLLDYRCRFDRRCWADRTSLFDRANSFGHRCSIARGCSVDPSNLFNHRCSFQCLCGVDHGCRFDNTSRFDHRRIIERRCGVDHWCSFEHRCGVDHGSLLNHLRGHLRGIERRCSVDHGCRFDNTSRFDHRRIIERGCDSTGLIRPLVQFRALGRRQPRGSSRSTVSLGGPVGRQLPGPPRPPEQRQSRVGRGCYGRQREFSSWCDHRCGSNGGMRCFRFRLNSRMWITGRAFLQFGRNLPPAFRADPMEHESNLLGSCYLSVR